MKNYSNVPETEPQFKDSENEKVEEKINEDALKYISHIILTKDTIT